MPKPPHAHAAAIDRLGKTRIIAHFVCTPQTVRNWRRSGIPPRYRKSFVIMATLHNVSVPEVIL